MEQNVNKEKESQEKKNQCFIGFIKLTLQVMQSRGWKDVPLESISLDDKNNAFIVSTSHPNTVPSVVVFRDYDFNCKLEVRLLFINKMFEKENLSPAIFFEEKDYYLQEFWGKELSNDVVLLAKLLARIHKIPNDWIDKLSFRKALIERFPALSEASFDSCIWPACYKFTLMKISNENLSKFIQLLPQPFSAAGRRLVTVHGDFFPANILVKDGIAKVIDFEFTCVSNAAQDLVMMFMFQIDRWDFAKIYFNEMGYPLDEEEIEAFVFDSVVSERLHFLFVRRIVWGRVDFDKEEIQKLEHFKFLTEQIFKCKQLRKKILDNYVVLRNEKDNNLWPWWSKERLQKEINAFI